MKLTSVQQSHLGAFLVRDGEDILETGKAFPKIVAAALLRLDALAADFLAAARDDTVNDVKEDPGDQSNECTYTSVGMLRPSSLSPSSLP